MPGTPEVNASASVTGVPPPAYAVAGEVVAGAVELPGVAATPPEIERLTASPAVAPAPQALPRVTLPAIVALPLRRCETVPSAPSLAVTFAVQGPGGEAAGIVSAYS